MANYAISIQYVFSDYSSKILSILTNIPIRFVFIVVISTKSISYIYIDINIHTAVSKRKHQQICDVNGLLTAILIILRLAAAKQLCFIVSESVVAVEKLGTQMWRIASCKQDEYPQ